ncbi:uncharacterized protein LOC116175517 [Photinus pyralis]|uniref:uncharacterized protein LOC116164083 n=1 Tax=Photinus pyralis TaxID=7054 RepID=UPI00126755E3|nr:uncharacterized protein LOC116164083 [Photinus pyralis]XP_031349537.1 uncharacterized protein LOC116175517 [Photinus pyralis]
MEVIFVTFEKQVWVLIAVSFIIVMVAWWIIMSCEQRSWNIENMAIAITNLTSLTILGSVATVPKSAILRCVLITYLVYFIHINCGFTSNLINILTKPQYEFQISNLKQLADSNLPIYGHANFLKSQFNNDNVIECKLYRKLKESTFPATNIDQFIAVHLNLANHRNCAVVETEDYTFKLHQLWNINQKIYKIVDNSITGELVWRLQHYPNHYFSVYFERFIASITESGIGSKMYKDMKEDYMKTPRVEDDEKVVLTLRHLCFAFAFLGFGLLLSTAVFFIELAIARRAYRRN